MPVLVRLCFFIVFNLFFIFALLEVAIKKCFFKLSKILEKYLRKYLLLLKLQAVGL